MVENVVVLCAESTLIFNDWLGDALPTPPPCFSRPLPEASDDASTSSGICYHYQILLCVGCSICAVTRTCQVVAVSTMPSLRLCLLAFCTLSSASFSAGGGQKPISPPSEGLHIPDVGLGLWNSKAKDAKKAVKSAFKAGYIHFDSAAAYGNEDYVGKGLAKTKLKRSEYWITSKLWNDHHRPDLVPVALKKTLDQLDTPYLDLYLMHWPVAFKPNEGSRTIIDQDVTILDTWRVMEDLVRANLTRFIGVSNFSPRQMDTILSKCDICPYAHEFETHPYLQQQEWVNYHINSSIKVIAYSPLANINPTYDGTHDELAPILEDAFWKKMAGHKNCTVAQAILAWGRQRGTSVIPKSVHKKRIAENLASLNISFTPEELSQISEQDRRTRFNNPSKGWGVELFEGLDDGSNRFFVADEL